MASASRALLFDRLRFLPTAAATATAYRTVRPLAAAGSQLLPSRPWLFPTVAPVAVTTTARRFTTEHTTASSQDESQSSIKSNDDCPPPQVAPALDSATEESNPSSDGGSNSNEMMIISGDDCDSSSVVPDYPDYDERCIQRAADNETICLDGCDFEHWLVVMQPPPGEPENPGIPRDDIIDSYIKTLAQVVGSEEEARQKIYLVSTRHYFAFGALVSEELSHKLKELPNVRWVLPDAYLDAEKKDYGGEPFINGKAVPYDPKYHEEWVRNNERRRQRFDRRRWL